MWRQNWRSWNPGGKSSATAYPCQAHPIPHSLPVLTSEASPWRKGGALCPGELASRTALHRSQSESEATIDASVERHRQRPNEPCQCAEYLGRFCEAQAELENCLQVFEHDPAMRATALGSLAGLFDYQNDVAQAIIQERRALALFEVLPDPRDRAISHNNLAWYLDRSGVLSALAEAPRHQLSALIYRHLAGLGQNLQTSLGNYMLALRNAYDAGTELSVPRVAELLANPAFQPLADRLHGRQIDVEALQAEVTSSWNGAAGSTGTRRINRRFMTMTEPIETPLAELLTQLEAAVRAEDREHATRLQQAILQRLSPARQSMRLWNAGSLTDGNAETIRHPSGYPANLIR